MKWVEFEGMTPSGKTSIWSVRSAHHGGVLGDVRWHAPWRKYAFMPVSFTVFDHDCLREIATFCETETKAHREARKEARTA